MTVQELAQYLNLLVDAGRGDVPVQILEHQEETAWFPVRRHIQTVVICGDFIGIDSWEGSE